MLSEHWLWPYESHKLNQISERWIAGSHMKQEARGGLVVLGDFNAHLGKTCGHRGMEDPNLQGVLLQEMMERTGLSAVSLGGMASGPEHTYCSSELEVRTIVDYILMDVEATSMVSSCCTHTMIHE